MDRRRFLGTAPLAASALAEPVPVKPATTDALRITNLKVHMLRRAPDPKAPPATGLLRIIIGQGIEGSSTDVTEDMARAIQGPLREVLVGRDPMEKSSDHFSWRELPICI